MELHDECLLILVWWGGFGGVVGSIIHHLALSFMCPPSLSLFLIMTVSLLLCFMFTRRPSGARRTIRVGVSCIRHLSPLHALFHAVSWLTCLSQSSSLSSFFKHGNSLKG